MVCPLGVDLVWSTSSPRVSLPALPLVRAPALPRRGYASSGDISEAALISGGAEVLDFELE